MQRHTIDLYEMARCRQQVENHAENFGTIGVGLGPEDPKAPWSGSLPAATRLVRTSQDLHVAARTQFAAAQEFLRRMAQGLGEEGRRTIETELANVEALRRVSARLG